MSGNSRHTPVLLDEVLHGLAVKPGGKYIDCTVGTSGHAEPILERSAPAGVLLGIDVDPEAIGMSERHLRPYGDRVRLVRGSFADLKVIAATEAFVPVDGVLLDVGLSSMQLARGERGFSFQKEGRLDMRMDPDGDLTAYHLVNELSEAELRDIIAKYGEDPKARTIAKAIVRNRPVETTLELADLVARTVGRQRRLHPATKTFQALRIAVNEELAALSDVLPQTVDILAREGRLAIITFHSLEDRLVKAFMVRESRDCVCPAEIPVCVCSHRRTLRILTKKPIRPSIEEISRNPRARSARLRIASRLGHTG